MIRISRFSLPWAMEIVIEVFLNQFTEIIVIRNRAFKKCIIFNKLVCVPHSTLPTIASAIRLPSLCFEISSVVVVDDGELLVRASAVLKSQGPELAPWAWRDFPLFSCRFARLRFCFFSCATPSFFSPAWAKIWGGGFFSPQTFF